VLPPDVREDRAVVVPDALVAPVEPLRPARLAWPAVEELGEPVVAALVRRDVGVVPVVAGDPLIDRVEAERELVPPRLDAPA
jgi:hypothetical protein